ncbi:MAG: M56 family metallopeptidase [Terracidiphilus sp.]
MFGIFRPVLLMPEGILELLTAEQLRAIVAHEMCHVRRRDNLTFAVHMLVEVLFWFHPLVWWVGARLVEERERACDEGVVEAGGEAEVYAEGILNVRTFYVESPVACVAGVTGADLKKRIVRIMTEQGARKLSSSRRLLLAMTGALALTVPLMLGLVRAQNGSANSAGLAEAPHGTMKLPKFDVVSIKPYGPSQMMIRIDTKPDGISVSGMPMHMIVREAFGVTNDRLLGEPDWVNAERYDIDAKVAPEDVPKLKGLTPQQRWEMLLPVLVERCGLKFHHETRNLTVYTLVVAKGGPKLTPSTLAGDSTKVAPERHQSSMGLSVGDKGMTLSAHGASIESIARWISLQIGSTVVDKTGLTGTYDYRLEFAPDESMRGVVLPHGAGGDSPPPEADGPSIFTALQEQLGLKLVAEKQSVDVVVIDGMERPTAN